MGPEALAGPHPTMHTPLASWVAPVTNEFDGTPSRDSGLIWEAEWEDLWSEGQETRV